ncbi:MAG: hypothetical protein QXK88_11770 [Desulfurococcaceae archaeon]
MQRAANVTSYYWCIVELLVRIKKDGVKFFVTYLAERVIFIQTLKRD